MLSLLLRLVTWLSLWIPFATAIEHDWYAITVPGTVTANVPAQATLNAEVHNFDTSYCHAFRVYLASSYYEKRYYFYDSDCYLIFEQTLCDPSIIIQSGYVLYQNTTFNFTIPADVGPSGNHYALKARTLKTDGSYYGAELESLVFDLEGGTGEWATYQRQGLGHTLWGQDGAACSGFACMKECAEVSDSSTNNTGYQNCANSCPNVSIDFEGSTYGGQPTAPLTAPSPCATQQSSRSVTATATYGTDATTTSTRTRRVAGAVDTGAASRHGIPLVLLPGLAAVFL